MCGSKMIQCPWFVRELCLMRGSKMIQCPWFVRDLCLNARIKDDSVSLVCTQAVSKCLQGRRPREAAFHKLFLNARISDDSVSSASMS